MGGLGKTSSFIWCPPISLPNTLPASSVPGRALLLSAPSTGSVLSNFSFSDGKDIIVSEAAINSLGKCNNYYIFANIQTRQGTESRFLLTRAREWGAREREVGWEVTANGHNASLGTDEFVLKLNYVHSYTTL